jgi:phosphatidylglycerol---prolipoprotein diacylglyceryl transferase
MHPRLFTVFDYGFPSYFVCLLTGFMLATACGALWAKRMGHDPDTIVNLGISMAIAGVVGARIAHVLFDGFFWDYVHLCSDPAKVAWKISREECLAPAPGDWLFGGGGEVTGLWDATASVCRPKQADCWAWANIMAGGLTYYGGFIGASLVAVWQLRRDRFPFWRAADMAGMLVPLGLGYGRMGCVLAGCCFGRPCGMPWALRFPPHSPAADKQLELGLIHSTFDPSLPVHPTQIYESLACLLMAALLILHLHGRKRYDGQVFLAFVAGYASLRFLLEFFRNDDRGGWLGLSTSQIIGIVLVALAMYLQVRITRRLGVAV